MFVYKIPTQSLNSLQQNFTTIKFYDSRVVTKYSSNIESLNSEQTIYRYIISSHFKKKKKEKKKKKKRKEKKYFTQLFVWRFIHSRWWKRQGFEFLCIWKAFIKIYSIWMYQNQLLKYFVQIYYLKVIKFFGSPPHWQ